MSQSLPAFLVGFGETSGNVVRSDAKVIYTTNDAGKLGNNPAQLTYPANIAAKLSK